MNEWEKLAQLKQDPQKAKESWRQIQQKQQQKFLHRKWMVPVVAVSFLVLAVFLIQLTFITTEQNVTLDEDDYIKAIYSTENPEFTTFIGKESAFYRHTWKTTDRQLLAAFEEILTSSTISEEDSDFNRSRSRYTDLVVSYNSGKVERYKMVSDEFDKLYDVKHNQWLINDSYYQNESDNWNNLMTSISQKSDNMLWAILMFIGSISIKLLDRRLVKREGKRPFILYDSKLAQWIVAISSIIILGALIYSIMTDWNVHIGWLALLAIAFGVIQYSCEYKFGHSVYALSLIKWQAIFSSVSIFSVAMLF